MICFVLPIPKPVFRRPLGTPLLAAIGLLLGLLVHAAADSSPSVPEVEANQASAAVVGKLSESQRDFLAAHPVLRVGVDSFWPPFQFALDGQATGYSVDLIRRLAEDLGVRLEFVPNPSLSELLGMLDRHEVDVLTSLYVNPERSRRFLFTQPYLSTHLAIFTRDDPDAPTSFADLTGHRVAMQRNDGAIPIIDQQLPNALVLYEDEVDALMALSSGKVDAFIGAALPTLYRADVNQIVGLRLVDYLRNEQSGHANTSLHFAVRPDWQPLAESLDIALASLPPKDKAALVARWSRGLVAQPDDPEVGLSFDERAFLQQRETLYACTVPDWLPYSQITASAEHRGLSADLTAMLATWLGVKIALYPTRTWPESLEAIREGKCDLLPVAMDVPSRHTYLRFSLPYTSQPFVITTLREAPFINELEDLGSARIAIVAGYAQGELIKRDHPALELVPVSNASEGLAAVRSGAVDGYVDSLATVAYELRAADWTELKVAGTLDFDLLLSVATRADTPLLGSSVRKTLAAMGPDEIEHLVDRWLSAPYEPPADHSWVIKWMLPILLALLLLYLWNLRLSKANRALAAAQAELAEKNRALAYLSVTDSLTQLSNRRSLDDILAKEIERCHRHRSPLSLLMLDLDHFKSVNDRFGHQTGDQVLLELGVLLREVCRQLDTPGRWGGEEFLICCPDTDAAAAMVLAERLRMRVEQHQFPIDGPLTVSIGVSTVHGDESLDSLIGCADRALYRAKAGGRNQVRASSWPVASF